MGEPHRSAVIVVPDDDGFYIPAGTPVGVNSRTAVWLMISGPISQRPPREHLSRDEFKSWLLGLQEAGYTFQAHGANGKPITIDAMGIVRWHLRMRLWTMLAVGAILIALACLVLTMMQLRPLWRQYREDAAAEQARAANQATRAADADRRAAEYKRFGSISEAEAWLKVAKGYRQKEAMHRRKAKEYLRRWW